MKPFRKGYMDECSVVKFRPSRKVKWQFIAVLNRNPAFLGKGRTPGRARRQLRRELTWHRRAFGNLEDIEY